jgi:hypothetical protein
MDWNDLVVYSEALDGLGAASDAMPLLLDIRHRGGSSA